MSEAQPPDHEDVKAATFDPDEADAAYSPFPSFSEWETELRDPSPFIETHTLTLEAREGADAADLERAVTFVQRAAAIDTGAIEGLYEVDRGFTFTVAAQAAMWEAAMDQKGAEVRDLFEAQLRAYELVLDAATTATPLSEAFIRRLHEEICAPQTTYRVHTPNGVVDAELIKGAYKTQPNHVITSSGSVHSYAPVDLTATEMHRLMDEIASPAFEAAHPACQAAYAHYCLVSIHPFADGNGRVARALASVFTYRGADIPLLVFADRKNRYFDALEQADAGNTSALNHFVLSAGITALNLTRESLRSAAAPRPVDVLDRFRRLLTQQRELTHQEMDALCDRVRGEFREILIHTVSNLPYPPGVSGIAADPQRNAPELSGFRAPRTNPNHCIQVSMQCQPPADAQVVEYFWVLVAAGEDEDRAILVYREQRPDQIVFRFDDVHPDLSSAAETHFRAMAERSCGELLDEMLSAATSSLREKGYNPR